jgi:hypothetical protein
MTTPKVKHNIYATHLAHAYSWCGLRLVWEIDDDILVDTWPATTCKNCLRFEPKEEVRV